MVRIPTFLLSLPDSHKMRNFMKNELHYDVQFLILHFKVFGDTLLAWLNFCSFMSQRNYPSKSIFFSLFFSGASLLDLCIQIYET